jgi:hypothetical protein
MERRGSSTTVAVTAAEVKGALAKTRTLSSEEEKALRMRFGAAEESRTPLPRAAAGNADLSDELLLIEMQLMRAFKKRAAATMVQPTERNAAKDRIVRALRKKTR